MWRNEIENETESVIYRYGFAYHPGIPDCVYAWQTAPIRKAKRRSRSGFGSRPSHAGYMTKLKIILTKEGSHAYPKD
jgi:hypothetical protein